MEDQFQTELSTLIILFSKLFLKINYDPSIRLQNWEEMPPDENASAFTQTQISNGKLSTAKPIEGILFQIQLAEYYHLIFLSLKQ
jgi:hypothetical protein